MSIPETNSVMLESLAGSKLGVWIAHGEGKFSLPEDEDVYNIAGKYFYDEYPGNPNGSDYSTAAICSGQRSPLSNDASLRACYFPLAMG